MILDAFREGAVSLTGLATRGNPISLGGLAFPDQQGARARSVISDLLALHG